VSDRGGHRRLFHHGGCRRTTGKYEKREEQKRLAVINNPADIHIRGRGGWTRFVTRRRTCDVYHRPPRVECGKTLAHEHAIISGALTHTRSSGAVARAHHTRSTVFILVGGTTRPARTHKHGSARAHGYAKPAASIIYRNFSTGH